MSDGWQELRERFPWPAEPPRTPRLVHGWDPNEPQWKHVLSKVPEDALLVEVGCWTGKTALHLLGWAPALRHVGVDSWTETPPALGGYWPLWRKTGMMGDADTPLSLYRSNLWDHRDRAVAVQASSIAGLLALARVGLRPALVYIDDDHGEAAVEQCVSLAWELFGAGALIAGHDYLTNGGSRDNGVARAVDRIAARIGRRVKNIGKVWWYE